MSYTWDMKPTNCATRKRIERLLSSSLRPRADWAGLCEIGNVNR
jgi:hypothetical protein